VPKPLRAIIGKREFKRSLKTRDPVAAKTLGKAIGLEVGERPRQAGGDGQGAADRVLGA
jgi:hypothetical protein